MIIQNIMMYISGVCLGTVSPKYLVVEVSESARFNCTPDAGVTDIQWYFGLGAQQSLVGSGPYWDVNNVKLSNAGLYQCTWMKSDWNRSQSSALLVVLGNIHSLEE